MSGGVYEIVNLADSNGKAYIGSSLDIARRWRQHQSLLRRGSHHCSYLQHAFDMYGEDAFAFRILEEVSEDKFLVVEQKYLDDYFNRGVCYNSARSVRGGGPLSEEHKRNISEGMKGYVKTEEHCRRLRESNTGLKRSDETRRRISEAKKGQVSWMKGRHHTEESKLIMSAAKKGNQCALGHVLSEEAKRTISEKNRGRVLSEDTRQRMSEAKGRLYPSFYNEITGKVIPAGVNLRKLCRERGVASSGMSDLKNGKIEHYKGWVLL